MGHSSAEPARRIALAFKTNIGTIKETCAMIRNNGVLIGIGKNGYFIIETIDELEYAIKLYHKRYITSRNSFDAILKTARAKYGHIAIKAIMKKIYKENDNGYRTEDEKTEQK